MTEYRIQDHRCKTETNVFLWFHSYLIADEIAYKSMYTQERVQHVVCGGPSCLAIYARHCHILVPFDTVSQVGVVSGIRYQNHLAPYTAQNIVK